MPNYGAAEYGLTRYGERPNEIFRSPERSIQCRESDQRGRNFCFHWVSWFSKTSLKCGIPGAYILKYFFFPKTLLKSILRDISGVINQ